MNYTTRKTTRMPEQDIITLLMKENLHLIMREILSHATGDEIFNLFCASKEKSAFFNASKWHSLHTSEDSIIWNGIKRKREASLQKMKQIVHDINSTDLENFLCLLTNADYCRLMQNTTNHEKTDVSETFTFALPKAAEAGLSCFISLNCNLLAVILSVYEEEEDEEDESEWPDGMTTVLLYDSRTAHMISSVSVKGDCSQVFIPKMTGNDYVIIYTFNGGKKDVTLWDALGTGKARTWTTDAFPSPYGDRFIYDVFLKTEYGYMYRQKMFKMSEGNQLFRAERFFLDNEEVNLGGPNRTACFVDGDRFHSVCVLSQPIPNRSDFYLEFCQIRSKEDFSLLNTIHVKFSSAEDPSASGFRIDCHWGNPRVIYLWGDKFVLIRNEEASSFEIRSLVNMKLAYVFNDFQSVSKTSWSTAKVENGYLTAQYTSKHVAVWRLPNDLLEQCEKCFEAGTVGSINLLWVKDFKDLNKSGSEHHKLVVDDSGVSYYSCFLRPHPHARVSTFRLPDSSAHDS